MRCRRARVLAAVAVALLTAGDAWASPSQESLLQDDDVLLHAEPAEVDHTMAELRDLGVDRVRLSVIWRDIAPAAKPADPSEPGAYTSDSLSHLDTAIRTAGRYGIKVMLNVRGGGPQWALGHPPKRLAGRDAFRPDANQFRLFVVMLGRRYSGDFIDAAGAAVPRVDTWSVWNEPNWGGLLQPQTVRDPKTHDLVTVAPGLYRRLFRGARDALDSTGHRDDTLLIGETAPIGNTKLGELSHLRPARFLRDLFCLDRRLRPLTGERAEEIKCDFERRGPLRASGYAHHPYSVVAPPAQASEDDQEIRLADSARLTAILDAAAKAGRIPAGLPLWYTEFGYQTNPPDPYRGVSPGTQAAWLVAAEHLTWKDPRVVSHAQFLLRDDEPRTLYPAADPHHWATYQTGLRFADGTPKPAYEAYRLPLLAPDGLAPGQPLTLWGLVRPGLNGTPQHVRLEFRPSADTDWTLLPQEPTTDDRGYFTATIPDAQAGEYRFQWVRPDAPGPEPAAPGGGRASGPLHLR